jgi:plasmid maintenance system antidote protein VapI
MSEFYPNVLRAVELYGLTAGQVAELLDIEEQRAELLVSGYDDWYADEAVRFVNWLNFLPLSLSQVFAAGQRG